MNKGGWDTTIMGIPWPCICSSPLAADADGDEKLSVLHNFQAHGRCDELGGGQWGSVSDF